MKKLWIYLLVFCLALCPVCVRAEETAECGYLIRIHPEAPMLLSSDDSLIPVCEGLFKTEDEAVADMYRRMEGVTVFPDEILELYDTYPAVTNDTEFENQWCLDTIGALSARQKGVTGKGVTVAVIDSGIKRDHPDFAQVNILPGYNAMDGALDVTDTEDYYGHGTSVCGIIAAQTQNRTGIAGIASDVNILPIKITDSKSLSLSSMLAGFQKALELGCDVINMSFGGTISHPLSIAEINEAVDEAVQKGISVICAVGNGGGTSLCYPAASPNAIGVGAINQDGALASFSQRNKSVWVTAPGNGITTLSYRGGTTSFIGTSAATPVVTAVVALIRQVAPDYTPAQIKTLLSETAQRNDGKEYCTSFGYGVVSVPHIMEVLKEKLPPLLFTYGSGSVYMHNNTENAIPAVGYFAEYVQENGTKKLTEAWVQTDIGAPGVSAVVPPETADTVMLWRADSFQPLIPQMELTP